MVSYLVLAVSGGLLPALLTAEEAGHTHVYSVCEVLEQLHTLDHQLISIRGIVQGGQHGAFLIGNCESKLTAKGFTWPNLIWLASPKNDTSFSFDVDAYRRVQKEAKRLRRERDDQVVITYVGMLEAQDLEKYTAQNRAGRIVGFGFGPDGDAPAQLLVKTLREPSVIRKRRNPGTRNPGTDGPFPH